MSTKQQQTWEIKKSGFFFDMFFLKNTLDTSSRNIFNVKAKLTVVDNLNYYIMSIGSLIFFNSFKGF